MKSSIHLLYGIIIGILLFASTGSFKEDKAEFKEEKMLPLGIKMDQVDANLARYKKEGWTIIDLEIVSHNYGQGNEIYRFALAGK